VFTRNDALFLVKELHLFPAWPLAFLKIFAKRQPHLSDGKRLAAALIKLGPSFIKLGQTLSTRSDLVGEVVAEELAMLRDKLPPFPYLEAKKIIEAEFGKPISEIYQNFDEIPIAAASVAQVHMAVTMDGSEVAVKVLRPDIRKTIYSDISLLYWAAAIAEKRLSSVKRLKPVQVVDIFNETMKQELDLRFEAAAASELYENCKNDADFIIPQILWDLTSEKVLTMSRISGIPISDKDALQASGLDLAEIAKKVAVIFYRQVFRDGFFHGDLHPGNLFVDQQGRIIAVDFGIMGRLNLEDRAFIAQVFDGFLNDKYQRLAELHFEKGIIPEKYSVDSFALACRSIAKPIVGKAIKDVSIARLLGHLFKVAEDFEMELQPQFLLLQKNMMLAEGLGHILNPSANMWEVVKPLVEDWARKHLGVRARVKDTIRTTLNMLHRLPKLIERMEEALGAAASKS
jgi:ubiquinone biosynthesis protein